jgi:hypothetical protein
MASPRRCELRSLRECAENIPAPTGTLPDFGIIAEGPLCANKRRYLTSEIFRGNLSARLKTRAAVQRR